MESGIKEFDVQKIINDTVNRTVLKLKMAGLMKDDRKTAYEKTEEVLRNYPDFLKSDQPYAEKLVEKVKDALDEISEDEYYELIEMIYFEGATREDCAEYFDCTVTTISRNKVRLINKLKTKLFSDDCIFEILL